MTARARIFWLAKRRAPRLFARVCVRQLALATARGFGVQLPRAVSGDADQMLQAYAQFTAAESIRAFEANGGELPREVGARLRREMLALASRVRSALKPRTTAEAWRIVAALYDSIQIEVQAGDDGGDGSSGGNGCSASNVAMPRCFFAQYYDPRACSLMAYMDEGLMAGIVGQGELSFSQRITQGEPACRAVFIREERR